MSTFTTQGIEAGILRPLRNNQGQDDQRPCPLLPR